MNNNYMMGKNERLQYIFNNIDEIEVSERLEAFKEAYYAADLGFSHIEIDKVIELFKGYEVPLPNDYKDKEKITVYRGGTEYGVFYGRAMSWTLNFKTAEFFANRDPRDVNIRYVVKAEIPKRYILDYNNDRNEQEILLIPNKLENLKHVDFKAKEWTEEERKEALLILAYQSMELN